MNQLSPLQRLAILAARSDAETLGWLKSALENWLDGSGELTALGLTGADRYQIRLALRNHHLCAAWTYCTGPCFSERFSILKAAIERLNRVRQGYQYQRQDGALFAELRAAAQWAEIPADRQLRSILCEIGDPFQLHKPPVTIIMKFFHEDFNDAFRIPDTTDQDQC